MAGNAQDASWRLRVLGAVVPVTALLLGITAFVPSQEPPLQPAPVPGASTTTCVDIADLSTVPKLDHWVSTVRGGPGFAGGDVGASTQLQDGRQLFVFGDTLRQTSPGAAPELVHNAMLVASPKCAQAVLPADGGAVVPNRSDGVAYWPMSVSRVQRPGYDLVGVAVQRERSNDDKGAGIFAFDVLGPSVALFVVPRGKVPQLIDVVDLGPDDPDPSRPMWGAASAVVGGWVYLYGTARPRGATSGGFSLRVARVRPDQLLHPDRWAFWDGRRWQGDAAHAVELIPSRGGVSQTLSVFEQSGRWYAVSKQDEVLGNDLAVWTSRAPEGPFDLVARPVSIPSDASTGMLRYMPLAHPGLLPRRGTMVVSYSQNNTDANVVEGDPRLYRPHFLRIDLPR